MQDLELKNAIEVAEDLVRRGKAELMWDKNRIEAMQTLISTAQEYQKLRQAMLSAKMPEKKKIERDYYGQIMDNKKTSKDLGRNQAIDEFRPLVARLETEVLKQKDLQFISEGVTLGIINSLKSDVARLEGEKEELELKLVNRGFKLLEMQKIAKKLELRVEELKRKFNQCQDDLWKLV